MPSGSSSSRIRRHFAFHCSAGQVIQPDGNGGPDATSLGTWTLRTDCILRIHCNCCGNRREITAVIVRNLMSPDSCYRPGASIRTCRHAVRCACALLPIQRHLLRASRAEIADVKVGVVAEVEPGNYDGEGASNV